MEPCQGAREPGVDPWGRGWSQQRRLGQVHSSTFQPRVRRRRLLGTRVRSAFITYGRERALVLQGPGDIGTRRVSVAQVGAGGCAFRGGSGSLLPGKADWSQTARLQGSHFPGAGWTLGGFNRISCRVPAPSSLRVTSQIPGTTTPLKSSLLWAGEPARSREEPPRTKWAREGKEVGAAAPPCKKFRETPRTPPPSLFRLIAHWRRQWQPTPVLLPGKSHRRRSLVGCSPWGLEQSDMSERFHFHFSRSCIGEGHGNPLQCSCLENPRDGGAW